MGIQRLYYLKSMKPLASSESQTLPEITWEHIQPRLIQRLREQAGLHASDHAWLRLTDEQLVQEAGLARQNTDTGGILFNVAGLVLLGSNEAIRATLPHYGTQAVFRPGNWRRGEVRELRSNLLDTYDQLGAFAAQHLPDQVETSARGEETSLRDAILGEIFANSLVHRDYGKAYRARFVIESDRVFLENGMVPGKKPGREYLPNPVLAHVFKQIGWNRKATAAAKKTYFGTLPLTVEGSVFRILAPFPKSIALHPAPEYAWDISEMLATQAPWKNSKAAQNEVETTRNALNDLIEDPMLSEVENMVIPAPIEGEPKPFATPVASPVAPRVAPAPVAAAPVSPRVTFETKAPVNGHARAMESPPPLAAKVAAAPVDVRPTVQGAKNQAVIQAERIEKILEFCKTPRYRSEVQAHVGIVNRDYFRKDILNPLIEGGLLAPTLPDKPNSPKQQYHTVSA